jgi:ABC-2 type transport system permease protein/sodium transport system permease protein
MNSVVPAPLSPAAQVGRVVRLARKELREILRDRRTIVTMVLMPLLLYPLIGIAFRQFHLSSLTIPTTPEYQIAFASEDEARALLAYLSPHTLVPEQANGTDARTDAILKPATARDLELAVRSGEAHLAVRVRNRSQAGMHPGPGLECELLYLEGSPTSMSALTYLESLCAAANIRSLEYRLQMLGRPARALPVRMERTALRDPAVKSGYSVAALVPLVLILMTITGAVYPAIDLTAGERERGTLEILVAAPIPRLGLLSAKYIAVVVVALLTALVNLVSMTATLQISGLAERVFQGQGLTAAVVLEVFGLLVLFAAFFSAVLLILTSFARSFKEAQAYLVPLMVVSLVPGMLGIMPGMSLEGPLALVPLLNIVLLARDLFEGKANPFAAAAVVGSTFLYALCAVTVAAQIFGAEAVLYSERVSWSHLFRRRVAKP